MAAAKKAPDLALLLSDEEGGEDPLADMLDEAEASEGEELPPGFQSAFEEYEAAEGEERAAAFYRVFQACKGG